MQSKPRYEQELSNDDLETLNDPQCDEEDIEEYREIDIEACENEIAEYQKEIKLAKEKINKYQKLLKRLS